MRFASVLVVAGTLTLAAAALPARAAGPTYTLGSYLGFERYAQDDYSVFVLSTSPSGFFALPEPGLRFGAVLPGDRVELAATVGANVIGGEGESIRSLGLTLEGQYFFAGWAADVKPYVGAHLGVSNLGYEGDGETYSRVGVQAGVRRMVSDGHGDVRLELRGGVIQGPSSQSLSDIGLRLGYNLWFR
jgi:hypothetical protein